MNLNEHEAFAMDMQQADSDAAWQAEIDAREERLEAALKKMIGHRSDAEDHAIIVAFCGMTDRVYDSNRKGTK